MILASMPFSSSVPCSGIVNEPSCVLIGRVNVSSADESFRTM
jgi:hypothetical protein